MQSLTISAFVQTHETSLLPTRSEKKWFIQLKFPTSKNSSSRFCHSNSGVTHIAIFCQSSSIKIYPHFLDMGTSLDGFKHDAFVYYLASKYAKMLRNLYHQMKKHTTKVCLSITLLTLSPDAIDLWKVLQAVGLYPRFGTIP